MKKIFTLLFGIAAAAFFSGCVNFYDYTVMPGDALTDEANMPYVARDMKIAEARKSFKKPVEITMSETGYRFLKVGRNYTDAGKHNISADARRDIVAAAEAKLISLVQGMSDFQIVNKEHGYRSDQQSTSVSFGDAPKNQNYLLTYSVANLEIKDAGDAIGAVAGLTEMTLAVSGVNSRNTSRQLARNAQTIKWYFMDVTIEITLADPNGKKIFTFAKNVVYPKKFPNMQPDLTLMKEAAEHAVKAAMGAYAIQFAPPLYVDETKGNGLFVRLSAGTAYGIQSGQTVRFYRNVVKKLPTLPGEPEKTEVSKQFIRTGIVGDGNAPVEKDHAWVYVKDNDQPGMRSVFTWTSAEIIR